MTRRVVRTLGGCALVFLGGPPACETPPTGPAAAPPDGIRGFNLADWTANGYASPGDPVGELDAAGANAVSIVITAYQADPAASRLRAHDPRTPTPFAVSVAADRALGLGMRVALKPHVDLDDGTWRGRIEPSDPDAWFAEYGAFVLEWARFAEAQGIGEIVIGTELAGTLPHGDRWRQLIADVRAVFSGDLSYAASWDEAHLVPFWPELDFVGIDFYYPVARRSDPGRLEILAEWQPWLARLERLHRQTGRPIVISEIGYRSVDGAALHPYAFGNDAAIDLAEQADLYWAAIEATGREGWIAGIYFWNWLASGGGGAEDMDYTPRGKPAEGVLREAWSS
ncbi:MAG: glycoside hydrolase family 113 [bacterium]